MAASATTNSAVAALDVLPGRGAFPTNRRQPAQERGDRDAIDRIFPLTLGKFLITFFSYLDFEPWTTSSTPAALKLELLLGEKIRVPKSYLAAHRRSPRSIFRGSVHCRNRIANGPCKGRMVLASPMS